MSIHHTDFLRFSDRRLFILGDKISSFWHIKKCHLKEKAANSEISSGYNLLINCCD